MADATYRVGIVGCGEMGRAHARAYERTDETTVVAAAERNSPTRDGFANTNGVERTFANHTAMLEAMDLDIVSICTWPATHARITVDAAEAGVDGIFCEKPMGTNLGQTDTMIEATERNDVVLTVGHQRRYDPVHEKARDLIAEGAIGEPSVVAVAHQDGLLNWGTHLIDLGRFLLGDPETEWVIGQFERNTDRHERGQPIEDRCMAQVCFRTGTRLTIEMDLPGPPARATKLQVYGTAGSLAVELGSRVTLCNEEGTTTYSPEAATSNRVAYLEDMLGAMEAGGNEHRCCPGLVRPTIEIMMSLYESTRTNGLVRMPLKTKANPLIVMLENGELELDHPGTYDIRLPYSNVDD